MSQINQRQFADLAVLFQLLTIELLAGTELLQKGATILKNVQAGKLVSSADLDVLASIAATALNSVPGGVGAVSDGTFTVSRGGPIDGTLDPVEYPLTWAGYTNALNEAVDGEDTVEFRAGPDGAFATKSANARAQSEAFQAAQAEIEAAFFAAGPSPSSTLN